MTPREVRDIRKALNLDQRELAEVLGLKGNGRVTVGRWETEGGEGPSGPAAAVLTYLAQGALDDTMKAVLPEHAFAEGENGVELVYRNWRPRYIAAVTTDAASDDAIQTAPNEWLSVAMWIDDPNAAPGWGADGLLKRAATAWEIYNQDSAEAVEA